MLRNLINHSLNFVGMVWSFSSTFRRHNISVLIMRDSYFAIQWLALYIIWFIIFTSYHYCHMVKKILVNTGSSHSMSPDGTEPQPDQMLTSGLWYPNILLENAWNNNDKHLFSRTLSHFPEVGLLMRHLSPKQLMFYLAWYQSPW